ncbi:phosphate ABC transporter, inner membrane subunit PstC [Chthoniobacter flavus Ellin428]|uniref:Phosphate transport system permease protein n=1 Tax=Chthoniobacter flavus Ellin428 TaxID=497964 RepID=B4CY92_9BACT|nr:phosphate ABC transporter permease subunit PstC [Chthoniobacter flavus]EDY21240.1 phosphate ABC transporter, inner membrane subunit PstC [Chthoniobacter flavus Ellin428]TCO87608.1 phosphate transport system permease protein [Chthoniobacter flavus]
MPTASSTAFAPTRSVGDALLNRNRFRILGLTPDDIIKYFFNGNAIVAVVVLALITIFLFREGVGFFGKSQRDLRLYRLAGLEYVDFIRHEVDEHTAMTRDLNAARLAEFQKLTAEGKTPEQVTAALASFDAFANAFGDSIEDVRGTLSDLSDVAIATKTKARVNEDREEQRDMLLSAGKKEEADKIEIAPVNFAAETGVMKGTLPAFRKVNDQFADKLGAALQSSPHVADPKFQAKIDAVHAKARALIASLPQIEKNMENWNYDAPVPASKAVTSFLFGREWLTASFWQDWYGIVPLFVGSLLVSIIALAIAVPLGISAAIYVSEIAGPREKGIVKPYIEFISAIPSVVLGFFGIAVLGTALRWLSQTPALSWFPGFPMSERLNALTAGCLLALISIPTIFSLAEDALNNVPKHFKEASYALGANRFQTIVRVLVPASLSGIISAVLLGFGRVIGETMIVLLCAGNRIAIPDFTQGLGAFFQPVHTMTGIIAQEMGEVVKGGIHYRALFMVGVVLFTLSLVINYVAQRIVHRYRISIG